MSILIREPADGYLRPYLPGTAALAACHRLILITPGLFRKTAAPVARRAGVVPEMEPLLRDLMFRGAYPYHMFLHAHGFLPLKVNTSIRGVSSTPTTL